MNNNERIRIIAMCVITLLLIAAYVANSTQPSHQQHYPVSYGNAVMSTLHNYDVTAYSPTAAAILKDPIMNQTVACNECGTIVECNVIDCVPAHFDCPGTTKRATICTTPPPPPPHTTTSTSTTSTSTTTLTSTSTTLTTTSTTTSTSTTSTAFYSCSQCVKPTTGFSCASNCQYQSSGPTNGCPSGYIACSPSQAPPKLKCGFLPQAVGKYISAEEPWYCPINQSLYLSWVGDIPIALIVVMLAFLIAGGIFMVGAGIKNNRIRNFGIGELYEAAASAIMVALFVYLSAVIFGLIPGIFVGAINPYALSLHLITTTINSAENVYSGLFSVYDYDMYLSTLSVVVGAPGAPQLNITGTVINFALLPLDIYFIEPTVVVSGFIYDGIMALYAEYYLIVFFAIAAIPVFLIPGVILRVLMPTRALGGIMISLAAGFYFVMPLLFAVAFYFTSPHMATQLNNAAALLSRYGAGKGALNNAVTPTSPLVTEISGIESSLNSFWLLILFYPPLISAVTYAFVVQLASFIGGTARMSSRARAKFI